MMVECGIHSKDDDLYISHDRMVWAFLWPAVWDEQNVHEQVHILLN